MKTKHIWATGLRGSDVASFTAVPGFDLLLRDKDAKVIDVLATIQAGFAITRVGDSKGFAGLWGAILRSLQCYGERFETSLLVNASATMNPSECDVCD